MLKLIGDHSGITLFFFIHPPEAKQKIPIADLEQKVLRYYEEVLSTKLIIL